MERLPHGRCSAWSQIQVFQTYQLRSPAFYGCAFCLIALVDLDLSACDFCSTRLTLLKVILRGRSSSLSVTVTVEPLVTTLFSSPLESFFSNVGHFHCAVMFDLESDVRYFEVACWGCFLMEGVSAWAKFKSLDLPASEVQLSTAVPSALSPL